MQLDEQQQAEREHLDALYKAIFQDDQRGAAVFDDLYKRFAFGAKVHTDGGIDAVLKTYRASAHREVVEYIVTRCNRAAGVDDDQQYNRGNES